MTNICKKQVKNINLLIKEFKSNLNFSFYYALIKIFYSIFIRLKLKTLSKICYFEINKYITNFLCKDFSDILCEYKDISFLGEKEDISPIWICWWTGEDTAPTIVKKCIKSIRMNAGKHPVIMIDQNNYADYIDVPDYILSKVNDQKMCIAHLCDYIRVSLIYKYGGLWLDTTIYCSQQIPEWYFDVPFFSCKKHGEKNKYISDYRWTTFCLGGWKGNVFYKYLKETFECYWYNHEEAIEYLLFDYIINLGYRNVKIFREMIDSLEYNNEHIDDLRNAMNKALPSNMFNSILQDGTVLYKLSWREDYEVITKFGDKSIAYDFINTQPIS